MYGRMSVFALTLSRGGTSHLGVYIRDPPSGGHFISGRSPICHQVGEIPSGRCRGCLWAGEIPSLGRKLDGYICKI